MGRPGRAWERHRKTLTGMGLPRELVAHVARDGVLADAIDGYAATFLRDSLAPPPIAPPPAGDNGGAGRHRRRGHPTTLRLKFRRSAWLCSDADGDVVLHTNIANGSSFASDVRTGSFDIVWNISHPFTQLYTTLHKPCVCVCVYSAWCAGSPDANWGLRSGAVPELGPTSGIAELPSAAALRRWRHDADRVGR